MDHKRLTVKDLLGLKGKRQLTQLKVNTVDEARACEAAGIDLFAVSERMDIRAIRQAAPSCFMTIGFPYGKHINADQVIRAGFAALQVGADAVYTSVGLDMVEKMAREGIPVMGHVGFIPYKSTWFGGFKAVGKSAEEALQIYLHTKAYQDAGAIGVEIELVPDKVASAISKRVQIICLSMGSGIGCDGQYLYATDVLGTNLGHIPRHAKVYRNLRAEYERIYHEMVAAFDEFRTDTVRGDYPEAKHTLGVKDEEYAKFLELLG